MKSPNVRIIGIGEGKSMRVKFAENISNKTIQENFPSIKKMFTNIKETYKTTTTTNNKIKVINCH